MLLLYLFKVYEQCLEPYSICYLQMPKFYEDKSRILLCEKQPTIIPILFCCFLLLASPPPPPINNVTSFPFIFFKIVTDYPFVQALVQESLSYLTLSQTGPGFYVSACRTSLSKTLWEKEKLLVVRNFFFSFSVFSTH